MPTYTLLTLAYTELEDKIFRDVAKKYRHDNAIDWDEAVEEVREDYEAETRVSIGRTSEAIKKKLKDELNNLTKKKLKSNTKNKLSTKKKRKKNQRHDNTSIQKNQVMEQTNSRYAQNLNVIDQIDQLFESSMDHNINQDISEEPPKKKIKLSNNKII